MHDQVAVVLHDPLTRFIAFDGGSFLPSRAQSGVHLFGKRVDLSTAGAGTQEQEIVKWGNLAHVQNDNVAALVVLGDVRALDSEVESNRRTSGRLVLQSCDVQRTSFRCV